MVSGRLLSVCRLSCVVLSRVALSLSLVVSRVAATVNRRSAVVSIELSGGVSRPTVDLFL